MTHQESISLLTTGHRHMQDLTPEVASILSRSGVTTGTAHVFNVGSTGVVGTIEFEPGLERDLPEILDELLPPNREYGHEQAWRDGNGHSHLQSSCLGLRPHRSCTEQSIGLGHMAASFSPRVRRKSS